MTTIDDLLRRDYPAELRRRQGRFFVTLPDLGVAVSGDSVEDTWRKAEQRTRELFEHHAALGTLDMVPRPAGQRLKRELTPFLIKAGAVAVVAVVVLTAASVAFTYALRDPLRKVAQRTGRAVVSQFTEQLSEAAAGEFTPEQDARIREAIRAAVPKLKPYAEELRPLFDNPPPRR